MLKIFEEHCQNAGLFIYEEIELDKKYFLYMTDSDYKTISVQYVFGDKKINLEELGKEYRYVFHERETISEFGNIFYMKTYIVRLKDEKLIGEAVSVGALGGELIQKDYAHVCPLENDGRNAGDHFKNHFYFLHSIIKK